VHRGHCFYPDFQGHIPQKEVRFVAGSPHQPPIPAINDAFNRQDDFIISTGDRYLP
jgi:hypothetical protein